MLGSTRLVAFREWLKSASVLFGRVDLFVGHSPAKGSGGEVRYVVAYATSRGRFVTIIDGRRWVKMKVVSLKLHTLSAH